MVRTQCFHCHGPGSIPGQWTKILQATQPKKKKKIIHTHIYIISIEGKFHILGNVYITILSEKCRAQNFTQDKIKIMHKILSWACTTFIILMWKIFFKGFDISDYGYYSIQITIMLVKQILFHSHFPFVYLLS